jgi:hypothetical protein
MYNHYLVTDAVLHMSPLTGIAVLSLAGIAVQYSTHSSRQARQLSPVIYELLFATEPMATALETRD